MHHENFTRQYDIDFLGLRPHNSVSLGSRTTILSHSFDIPRATLVKHITFTGRATASEAFPASISAAPSFPETVGDYRWTAYLPPSYVGMGPPLIRFFRSTDGLWGHSARLRCTKHKYWFLPLLRAVNCGVRWISVSPHLFRMEAGFKTR